jgi:glycosyltransferase involved in cell wall biosynthesis
METGMKLHKFSAPTTTEISPKKTDPTDRSSIVEVLLATFNGERFLRQQIDSILSQSYENLRILARDDGSSDSTMAILKEYEQRFPQRFRVIPKISPDRGAKENFLQLMKASTADYACFSDQDDVWLADKVEKTMLAMAELESHRGTTTPLLVFTDLRVVDDTLKTLHESFWQHSGINPEHIHRLNILLGHNVVTGCTMLINRSLLTMALQMPQEAAMHDSWIALLASSFGAAAIVPDKTVMYRQHDQNVIGANEHNRSPRELISRFLQRESRMAQWKNNERVVEALLRIHGEALSFKQRQILNAYLRCGRSENSMVRVTTMIQYRFFRSGLVRNMTTFLDLWRGKMNQPS